MKFQWSKIPRISQTLSDWIKEIYELPILFISNQFNCKYIDRLKVNSWK